MNTELSVDTAVTHSTLSSIGSLATFGAITAATSALGAAATREGRGLWYSLLRKPSFQPPRRAFAPVWTALYGAIAVSGWRAWRRPASRQRSVALAWWGAQMAFNGAWSWLFFSQKRPRAALADQGALLASITGYTLTVRRIDRGAAWLMAPYFGWICFASVLNAEVIRRNRFWPG